MNALPKFCCDAARQTKKKERKKERKRVWDIRKEICNLMTMEDLIVVLCWSGVYLVLIENIGRNISRRKEVKKQKFWTIKISVPFLGIMSIVFEHRYLSLLPLKTWFSPVQKQAIDGFLDIFDTAFFIYPIFSLHFSLKPVKG